MMRTPCLIPIITLVVCAGCTLDLPLNPGNNPLADLIDDFQSGFQDLIEDPLDTRPFPVLFGGNSQHVYYATSLTDVKINFAGPANDIVLPSFVGPSNLYKYEEKERELIEPLILSGAYYGMETDGQYVAYIRLAEIDPAVSFQVIALKVGGGESVVYDSAADDTSLYWSDLALADGRLAFTIYDAATDTSRIRIVDLTNDDPAQDIETDAVLSLALRGNRLAYVEGGTETRVVLRDLATDDSLVVAPDVRSDYYPRVYLTNNHLVWDEPFATGVTRIAQHDLTTGAASVRFDAAAGTLVGATDDFSLTEERRYNPSNGVTRIHVWRYGTDESEQRLASFRADGLAGQTQIIGPWAAWVNPDRQVILAPLTGGERRQFRPF